jgi:hypothetical protein
VDPSEPFFCSSCCRVCLAKLEKSDMVAQLTSFQQIYESREREHYPMAFAQLIIYQHNLREYIIQRLPNNNSPPRFLVTTNHFSMQL